MAPHLHDKSSVFNTAEPVQIISGQNYTEAVISQAKPSRRQQRQQSVWKKISRYAFSKVAPFYGIYCKIGTYIPQDYSRIVWRNVFIFVYLHIAALYGFWLIFTVCQVKTFIWGLSVAYGSLLGVTCGAHRLWAHRSYKAKLPLRIILIFCQTVALQNSIYEWVRDHRVHHKFTDTDADPHNSNRGFFFSHMGWLMTKKHKDVFTKGREVDMSDIEADPVVRFQRRYYLILGPLLSFALPAIVPWYFWNESWTVCWYTVVIFRYMSSLHGTWCINSVAHMFGTKPFDKNISAVQNKIMGVIGCGEGWHNYHHVFPWDYKAHEFGNYPSNWSVAIIESMAKIGWAYDLKTVSVDIIDKRAKRTGDGSRKCNSVLDRLKEDHYHGNNKNNIWGWDDKDMTKEDREMVEIHHTKCVKSE